MAGYFLSYARGDQHVALPFADALKAAGVALWVDQYDIRPSEHWDRAVEAALRASDGVVILLSPRAAASGNVADEVSVAVDAEKHLIPVMIETCTPPLRLTRVQFIDATRDRDDGLVRCLAAIRAGAAVSVAEAAPRPSEPLPAEALAEAERRLTPLVGPIAAELVRRAARHSVPLEAFHAELAGRLPERDRARFLQSVAGNASPPDPPARAEPPVTAAIPAEALEALTRALVRHLGPIAGALVARESAAAAGKDDLIARLGARIPAGRERAAFLKAAAAI